MSEHISTSCGPYCSEAADHTSSSIGMTRSEWIGDKQNGVKLSYIDDELDEALLYVDGACRMHMEGLSDVSIWFGLYPGGEAEGRQVNINVASKNLRSYIEAKAEEQ